MCVCWGCERYGLCFTDKIEDNIQRQNKLVSFGCVCVCGDNLGARSATDVLVRGLNVLFLSKLEQHVPHAGLWRRREAFKGPLQDTAFFCAKRHFHSRTSFSDPSWFLGIFTTLFLKIAQTVSWHIYSYIPLWQVFKEQLKGQ